MKALALILWAFVSTLGAACVNTDTSALFDVEGNLNSETGNYNATAVGTLTYLPAGAWHGSYAVSSTAALNYFTVPKTAFSGAASPAQGTVELSFRTSTTTGTTVVRSIFSIQTSDPSRQIGLYQYGGNVYCVSDGVFNTAVGALANSTNYYYKVAWNATKTEVYRGTWTVPGTTTLTLNSTLAAPSMAGTTSVVAFLEYVSGSGFPFDGTIDWIRIKPTADFTATVTQDVCAGGQLSPYMKNSTTNKMMNLFLFFMDKLATRAYALEADTAWVGRKNSTEILRSKIKYEKEVLDKAVKDGKVTVTPTPTPNIVLETATPTPVPAKEQAKVK